MKSVTNSNRVPFQVKRYGQDEGLRSSSVHGESTGRGPRPGRRSVVSACRMPDGHSTRTTSAPCAGRGRTRVGRRDGGRRRRRFELLPQAAGAQLDLRSDAAAVADARRPAARAARRCRLPPSLRHTRSVAAPIADDHVACRRRRRDRRAPALERLRRAGRGAGERRARHVDPAACRRCATDLQPRCGRATSRSSRPSLS